MDISFVTGEGKFNYRVCAVILREGRILAMRDERSPYYYLPGGRVRMGERAEDALLREMREELDIEPEIVRPLWLNQSFFTEDVERLRYHELCLYFLTDVAKTDLPRRGGIFTRREGMHTHTFQWLDTDKLRDMYFYPTFLKEGILRIPDMLTLRTEIE